MGHFLGPSWCRGRIVPSASRMVLLQFVVRLALFASSLLVYSYLDLLDLKLDLSGPLQLFASSAANSPPNSTNVVGGVVSFLVICFVFSGSRSIRSIASVLGLATLAMAALWTPDKTDPLQRKLSQICFLTYTISSALYLMLSSGQAGSGSDDTVRFKPYEAEIRQFLLKNDPSRLHTVDTLLEKEYRGKGQELLKKLQQEYSGGQGGLGGSRGQARPPQAPAPLPASKRPPVPGPSTHPYHYGGPTTGGGGAPAVPGPEAGGEWRSDRQAPGRYGAPREDDAMGRSKEVVRQAAMQYQEDVRRRQEERINRLHQQHQARTGLQQPEASRPYPYSSFS